MQCSMGTATAMLTVLPDRKILLDGQPQANITDSKPLANIPPFGLCTSLANPVVAAATAAHLGVLTPMPCVPNPTGPWQNGKTEFMLKGAPALCQDCKLTCMWAGTISLVDSGQGKGQGAFPLTKEGADGELLDRLFINWETSSANVGDEVCLHVKSLNKNRKSASFKLIDADTGETLKEFNVQLSDGEGYSDNISITEKWEGKTIKSIGEGNVEEVVYVNYSFGDPIDDPTIRQDGAIDSVNNGVVYNPIIGYYGDAIRTSIDGSPIRHTGFDYLAPEGTSIKAVHGGTISKIRIGHPSMACQLRKELTKTVRHNPLRQLCSQCGHRSGCYGIQLWLKITQKEEWYAFYAHLSGINEKIWHSVKNKIIESDSDYNPGIEVSKNDIIGLSGCTGNASKLKSFQEHLHFEFRSGNEDGTKNHPNYIVSTKFIIIKDLQDVISERNKIDTVLKLYANKKINKDVRDEILQHIDKGRNNYIKRKEK